MTKHVSSCKVIRQYTVADPGFDLTGAGRVDIIKTIEG